MAIKHQSYNEKHPYASPTTPGLYVTFRNYIIELVCLNVNPKLGPRFWSDKKYWAPKYKREIRGISNLGKELDLTDTLTKTALIKIINEYCIKALVSRKTINRVIKFTHKRIVDLKEQKIMLSKKSTNKIIDTKKNATFVDMGKKNIFAKVKEIENE